MGNKKLLIKANYNHDLKGCGDNRNFGVEIEQEFIMDEQKFDYTDNLTDFEFFETEEEAIQRAKEINELKTDMWSEI